MSAAITFRNVSYSDVLNDFSCEIETGQRVLVVTAREEESTVLTRLAAGLLMPEQGAIEVFGNSTSDAPLEHQVKSRIELGIIPFNGGLVSNLKMWENIFLPHFYHRGIPDPEVDELADNYLTRLNCSAKHTAFPAHLSIFEKRAAAFTRAAIMKPDVMIYCNTLERISKSDQARLATVMNEFHSEKADRTSIYLSSTAELSVQADFDAVLYIHPQKETGTTT
jgi:phospholipid/cholesterol/gamma-HCH transport system ATP-binding protein